MKPLLAALLVLSAVPAFAQDPGKGVQSQEELLKQLDQTAGLKTKEKSFQVALSLGKLYYGNGRFPDSVSFLKEAVDKGEALRAFYVAERNAALSKKQDLPSAGAAGCDKLDPQNAVERGLELAQQKAKAGQHGAAASCARVALTQVLEARQLLSGALFDTGDAEGALKVLEGSLEAAPDDADALWAHASLLLETRGDEVKALKQAKAEFERTVTLRPDTPRNEWTKKILARVNEGIAAGGLGRLDAKKYAEAKGKGGTSAPMAMGGPMMGGGAAPMMGGSAPMAGGGVPQVSPEAMQAIQNTERTPEMVAGLQKLVDEAEDHLAHGRFEEALDNYKRVVPFEPENGRAKAGMAWSLVGLNKQPMADRVWQVAVQSDPAAVDGLGKTLKQKGDEKGAKALWAKLAGTDPGYAARSGLAARLEK